MIPRQVNSVFVRLPEAVIESLREKQWHFYTFIGVGGVRFMCSWNSTQERIDQLVQDIRTAIAALS